METSELPISYEDLNSAYTDLLQDKTSKELFQNTDKNRIRRFINNPFDAENNMVEYEQRGKAWEKDKAIATGKEFNR